MGGWVRLCYSGKFTLVITACSLRDEMFTSRRLARLASANQSGDSVRIEGNAFEFYCRSI